MIFTCSDDFAFVLTYINKVLWCNVERHRLTDFIFVLHRVFITGVRHMQPTQSVERPLYLKHHTYPVVPFNTY